MMDSDQLLILARAVHFGTCLLAMSVCWFNLFVMRGDLGAAVPSWTRFARCILWIAIPLAALSGAAWFALIVMGMSGFPFAEAMQPHILGMVWRDTKFGKLWQLRAFDWLPLALSSLIQPRKLMWPAVTFFSAVLLGSLAWSGHGRYGSKQLHLAADALHLLIAAAWPAGLLPFAILLFSLRRTAQWQIVAKMTNRFSAMSLFSVAVLATTGIVNSCYMLNSISDLSRTAYGRMLLAKICVFAAALVMGAVNLMLLKPRLAARDSRSSRTALALQVTTSIEILCAIAAIAVVALLGTLAPPHD
jgi:putative copper resistance protein D